MQYFFFLFQMDNQSLCQSFQITGIAREFVANKNIYLCTLVTNGHKSVHNIEHPEIKTEGYIFRPESGELREGVLLILNSQDDPDVSGNFWIFMPK